MTPPRTRRRKRRCSMWRISAAVRRPPRPIMFVFNGGPGSSTVWLHMGAFGPQRVVTLDDSHTPAAPYPVVNNDFSLLDASDLVFVDAPGTGFGRIVRQRQAKRNFSASIRTRTRSPTSSSSSCRNMDDGIRRNICSARAMARRALRFWPTNSRPNDDVDFNGVILLSQI